MVQNTNNRAAVITLKSPSGIFTRVPKFIFFFSRGFAKSYGWSVVQRAHPHEIIGHSHTLCLQFSYPTYVARLFNKDGGISDVEGQSWLKIISLQTIQKY